MKGSKVFLVLSILVVSIVAVSGTAFALAPEYMRNGECYLLVGHDDVNFRGVYRLNNPSGEPDGNPINVKLYDPRTSHGISVNLNRNVYTFSENTDPTSTYDSAWVLSRLLKVPGGVSLYGAHCDTRKHYYVSTEGVAYNQSNQPVYTTTGPMGNETGTATDGSHNICWEWSGTVSVLKKEAARWKVGKTVVKCDNSCPWGNGLSDRYWVYFVSTDAAGYGNVPNGAWWQSRDADPHGRPGNIFYWDRAYRKYTYYDLNRWDKTMGIWAPSNPIYAQPAGPADSVFEENVKRSRISACMNYCCVNGSGEEQFSPEPKYVSLALSPFGRMYLYSRTQNAITDGQVKMNGTPLLPANPNIRGALNDLTTRWVGVSAKSSTEDFVYLLGTNQIRQWLAQFSIFPASLNIDAVTVSDQWWLEGGIVYAYDATIGVVYQFVRSDASGNDTCKSTPKPLNLGTGIDDIKADGFGNIFFSRTTKNPSAGTSLSWGDTLNFVQTSTFGGRGYGLLYYGQKVDKTVFKRESGASTDSQVGSINIGNNQWVRYFSVVLSDWGSLTLANLPTYAGLPTWQWHGDIVQVSTITSPLQIQLGVINVSTPPLVTKPNDRLGAIDILAFDSITENELTHDYGATEVNQGLYTFRAENSTYWESRNNQVVPGKTKWEGDHNGNGFEGGFVSSLMNTGASVNTSPQVLYTWRIYRIQDAFGIALPTPELVKELAGSTSPNVKYYFRSGLYQIECGAQFKYYDYNALRFGSTVASLGECIRPVSGYESAIPAPTPPGVNFTNFPGLKTPIPSNSVVAILKVNRLNPPPTGELVDIQKYDSSVPAWANPSVIGAMKYHVIDEKQRNSWRVDGSLLPKVFGLPVVNDSNMVPASLKWENDAKAQFEWNFNLRLPDGSDYPAFSVSKATDNPADTDIPFLLNFPTDPVTGSLTCKIYRDWIYQRNVYNDDGDYQGTEDVKGHIEYNGEVGVLVLDKTPPEVVSINTHSVIDLGPLDPLYLGTTYGLITDAQSYGSYDNPATFTILVRDNNIYANMSLVSPIPEHKHDRGKEQRATMFFERGSDKSLFPDPGVLDADLNYYTSPGVATVPDIVGTPPNWMVNPQYQLMRRPLPYQAGAQYSYLEYVFLVAHWRHLQSGTGDSNAMDYCMRLPVDFANNSTTYMAAGAVGNPHKGFGVLFAARDSSANAIPVRAHLGNIWVRDTLGPVPTVRVLDYAKNVNENEPFNIESYLVPHPNPLRPTDQSMGYHLLPTTPLWAFGSDAKISGIANLSGIPWNLSSELVASYHPPLIDEGMEIFLSASATDNIGLSFTFLPQVTINGPNGLYKEENPDALAATSVARELRVMLERSGVYNLKLEAKDNALGYDGTAAPNSREIDLGIVVAPTGMNVRVIDKRDSKF